MYELRQSNVITHDFFKGSPDQRQAFGKLSSRDDLFQFRNQNVTGQERYFLIPRRGEQCA